jgi:hypothetical protein
MEKNFLKFDEFASTYGWRIKVKAEFDYRKDVSKPFVLTGFSAYQGVPEMKNKKQLLLINVAALFEKRWIYKSDGILIYKASNDRLLRSFDFADVIIHLKKDGDCVDVLCKQNYDDTFVLENIAKMAKHYNSGYQRNVPLRIVQ